jgi:hypothetical protein
VGGHRQRQRHPRVGARTARLETGTLLITVRRSQCTGCGHVRRQHTSRAAEPRAKRHHAGGHTHRWTGKDRPLAEQVSAIIEAALELDDAG